MAACKGKLKIEIDIADVMISYLDRGRDVDQGLSRLCVQRVIWTRRTLFFDSLDTQKFMSEFAEDDFS